MSQSVTLIASLKARPEVRQQFVELLGEIVRGSRSEPGCEVYDLYADAEGGFHLIERYANQAALDAHRLTEHYLAFRGAVGGLLEKPVSLVALSEVDRVS
jgi:quinol monooxygenase YgiN